MRFLSIALMLLLTSSAAHSQINHQKWAFGVNVGSNIYQGDLNSDINDAIEDRLGDIDRSRFEMQMRGNIGIELERKISQRLGLRLAANIGQVAGNDRWNVYNNQYERSLNFETEFASANAVVKLSAFKRKSWFNIYVMGGVGITAFNVYGDLLNEENEYYDYSQNIVNQDDEFETDLTELNLQRDYKTAIMNIPAGLGIRIKVLPRVSLHAEVEHTFLFTDYFDNVSDIGFKDSYDDELSMIAANPNPAGSNQFRGNQDDALYDMFTTFKFGIRYNFGGGKRQKKEKSGNRSFGSRIAKVDFSKAVPKAVRGKKAKFTPPVFYPSKNPSSVYSAEDAMVNPPVVEVEVVEEIEIIEATDVTIEGETVTTELNEESLALVDEAIAMVEDAIEIQEEQDAKIIDLEAQIAELKTMQADETAENDTILAEINRLETEIDAAVAEKQAAQIAAEEAIAQIEEVETEVETITAVEEETTELEVEMEEVEEAPKKMSRKEKRAAKKAAKEAAKAAEQTATEEMESDAIVMEASAAKAADSDDNAAKVCNDDCAKACCSAAEAKSCGEDCAKACCDKPEMDAREMDRKMTRQNRGGQNDEVRRLRNDVDELRYENTQMQLNGINQDINEIKMMLNQLLMNGGTANVQAAPRVGTQERVIIQRMESDNNNAEASNEELKKAMQENAELKKMLEAANSNNMMPQESKEVQSEEKKTEWQTLSSDSEAAEMTTTQTTSQPSVTTGFDYNNMQEVGRYNLNYNGGAISKEQYMTIAQEAKNTGGVLLIKAYTTEYGKSKMRASVMDIHTDFIQNHQVDPKRIDSSIHIAADGVTAKDEVFVNGEKLELIIYK